MFQALPIKQFVLLVCLFLPASLLPQVLGYGELDFSEYQKEIDKFDSLVKWNLSPLGKLGADFVKLFVIYDSGKVVHDTILATVEGSKHFLGAAISRTLVVQIPLTIGVAVGIMILLALLLLPCAVADHVNRTKRRRRESGANGWILLEFLFVFWCIAMFFTFLAAISAVRGYYTLEGPYELSTLVVEQTSNLKKLLRHNFLHRSKDISRSAFDLSQTLYNVNEKIAEQFMELMGENIDPVLSLALSMRWELAKAKDALEEQDRTFSEFINAISKGIGTYTEDFTSAIESLKKEYVSKNGNGSDEFLDPLWKTSKLNSSINVSETFAKPINALAEATKLNLSGTILQIGQDLRYAALKPIYDPADLISDLRHSAFKIERDIRDRVAKYIAAMDSRWGKEHQMTSKKVLENLRKSKTSFLNSSFHFFCFLVSMCILGLILLVISGLTYCFGVLATNCFDVEVESNQISKNRCSHCCGRILLKNFYFTACTLWMFWSCSVMLFVSTGMNLELCETMQRKTIFKFIDSDLFRKQVPFHSLISSDEFNSTLEDKVINCAKDKSYFPVLPDPLVNKSIAENIKSKLDFSNATSTFNSSAPSVSFNISDFQFAIGNLTNIMDGVDTHSFFEILKDNLMALNDTNAPKVLGDLIEDSNSSSSVIEKSEASLMAYESLIANLASAIADAKVIDEKMDDIKSSILVVVKELDYLMWSADALEDYITKETVHVYSSAIKSAVDSMVDGIIDDIEVAATEFRESISLCNIISLIYEKATVVFCELILHPVAACWLGFTALTIFLLFASLVSYCSVTLFVIQPQEQPASSSEDATQDVPLQSSESFSKGSERSASSPESSNTNRSQTATPSTSKDSGVSEEIDKEKPDKKGG